MENQTNIFTPNSHEGEVLVRYGMKFREGGRDGQVEHRQCPGSETTVSDIVMVDTCHYTSCRYPEDVHTACERERKPGTSVNNPVSILAHQLQQMYSSSPPAPANHGFSYPR